MHLKALAVNRQGECFRGLEDRKPFFLFNPKQLHIYQPVSPNKRKHTENWRPDVAAVDYYYF